MLILCSIGSLVPALECHFGRIALATSQSSLALGLSLGNATSYVFIILVISI